MRGKLSVDFFCLREYPNGAQSLDFFCLRGIVLHALLSKTNPIPFIHNMMLQIYRMNIVNTFSLPTHTYTVPSSRIVHYLLPVHKNVHSVII